MAVQPVEQPQAACYPVTVSGDLVEAVSNAKLAQSGVVMVVLELRDRAIRLSGNPSYSRSRPQ